jgi:hypothetical protein
METLAVESEFTVIVNVTGIPVHPSAEVSVTLSMNEPTTVFQFMLIRLVFAGSGIMMLPPPDKLQL